MKKAFAMIGGATALALMLAVPGGVSAEQASSPQAGMIKAGTLQEARPTVTVNIVSGDLAGQEKRDFDLLERAMRDMQTRGYAGLDRHLPALRRAMERAPAIYPHTEKRAANDWIVRTLDSNSCAPSRRTSTSAWSAPGRASIASTNGALRY